MKAFIALLAILSIASCAVFPSRYPSTYCPLVIRTSDNTCLSAEQIDKCLEFGYGYRCLKCRENYLPDSVGECVDSRSICIQDGYGTCFGDIKVDPSDCNYETQFYSKTNGCIAKDKKCASFNYHLLKC